MKINNYPNDINPWDKCQLYIALRKNNRIEFGTSDNYLNILLQDDSYKSVHKLLESTRTEITDLDCKLKRKYSSGYIEYAQLKEFLFDFKYFKRNSPYKSLLFLAPHGDDETLSFGGYMIDMASLGHRIYLHVFACGGVSSNVSTEIRTAELQAVAKALGIYELSYDTGLDGVLETIPNSQLTKKIDNLLTRIKPDEVFCTYESVHRDHIALYNAFQGSMRLKEGFMPNLVALGEYPFILTSYNYPSGGKWYHPLSEETFKKKCEAFKLHKSQLKLPPSPLGVDGIEILARTRGMECGHKYAELFYLQKLVR